MNGLPNKLLTKLEADAKSTLDSYYEPLKDRKRQELEDLELQHQEALENLKLWLRGENATNAPPQIPPPQEASRLSPESLVTRNGSSARPSRRTMLLAILPSLKDRDFIRKDVEAKIIEKWPEVEPKTEAEQKSFTSSIAHLLTKLVNKGQLESTDGKTSFEPRVYRVIDNDEDTLLKSGP